MNTLLIFFALPIAVIIISIALQKLFKNPFLVAGIVFAVFLVVTFIIDDLTFLVATIAYTILAFVTAVITHIICRIIAGMNNNNSTNGQCEFSNLHNSLGDEADTITVNNSLYPENTISGKNGNYYRGCRK